MIDPKFIESILLEDIGVTNKISVSNTNEVSNNIQENFSEELDQNLTKFKFKSKVISFAPYLFKKLR